MFLISIITLLFPTIYQLILTLIYGFYSSQQRILISEIIPKGAYIFLNFGLVKRQCK